MSLPERMNRLGPLTRACVTAGTGGKGSGLAALDGDVSSMLKAEAGVLLREGLADTADVLLSPVLDGDGEASREVDVLRATAVRQHAVSLAVLDRALPLSRTLSGAGIGHSIIKGPAASAQYPPGWPRTYNDVDLVVERSDFAEVIRLCKAAGWYEPDHIVPSRDFVDQHCREGINLYSGVVGNVDVHHEISPWAFSRGLPPKQIIARSLLSGEGEEFPSADPIDSAVIAALHILNDAWKGKLGLQSWRDLLVLSAGTNLSALSERFSSAGLDWLLALIALGVRTLDPDAPLAALAGRSTQPRTVLAGHPVTAARLWAVGYFGEPKEERAAALWVGRLPVLRAAAFLAAAAVPSRRFLGVSDGSYRAYWARVARGQTRSDGAGVQRRTAGATLTTDEVRCA